ncbi:MAG: mechanosensitive ion channel family protein [Clostridia bacterium]|nr:mechanosensitive ion channel family protein [Clostridia bacterium]
MGKWGELVGIWQTDLWTWITGWGWQVLLIGAATILAIAISFHLLTCLSRYLASLAPEARINQTLWLWLRIMVSTLLGATGAIFILRLFGLDATRFLAPVWKWLGGPGLRILAAGLGAWLSLKLLHGVIDHADRLFLGKEIPADDPERTRRLNTLRGIAKNVTTVIVMAIAATMILKELGFDITALLTAVGVGGLAVGLAAQNLIRDYLTGFLLLAEDQLRVGDVVEINGKGGVVEQITLRTVWLRALDGTLHIVPNSQITTVSNMTKSFSRYVIDVEVAYKENLDWVMDVLKQVGQEIATDDYYGQLITEPVEVLGVDRFEPSGVVLKLMVTTLPLKQWEVGRELRRRIKNRFDELGIEIPFPHVSVYWRSASEPIRVIVDGEPKERKPSGQAGE